MGCSGSKAPQAPASTTDSTLLKAGVPEDVNLLKAAVHEDVKPAKPQELQAAAAADSKEQQPALSGEVKESTSAEATAGATATAPKAEEAPAPNPAATTEDIEVALPRASLVSNGSACREDGGDSPTKSGTRVVETALRTISDVVKSESESTSRSAEMEVDSAMRAAMVVSTAEVNIAAEVGKDGEMSIIEHIEISDAAAPRFSCSCFGA